MDIPDKTPIPDAFNVTIGFAPDAFYRLEELVDETLRIQQGLGITDKRPEQMDIIRYALILYGKFIRGYNKIKSDPKSDPEIVAGSEGFARRLFESQRTDSSDR